MSFTSNNFFLKWPGLIVSQMDLAKYVSKKHHLRIHIRELQIQVTARLSNCFIYEQTKVHANYRTVKLLEFPKVPYSF